MPLPVDSLTPDSSDSQVQEGYLSKYRPVYPGRVVTETSARLLSLPWLNVKLVVVQVLKLVGISDEA